MMRITTWHQVAPPPPGTSPTAVVDAFRELAQAVKRIPGAGDIQWGFGNGGIVTAGFPENYAAADAILKDSAMQAAVGKLFLLGIGIAEDVFVITPEQALPFVPREMATAATA